MAKYAVDLTANQAKRDSMIRRALGPHPSAARDSGNGGNVAAYLVYHNYLELAQARAATLEARARGVPIASALAEQGAVTREKIVEGIENVDVTMLAAGLEYDVRLPRRILRENKIVIHAQTDTKLMVSSTTTMTRVRQLLGPHAAGREILPVPFSFQKWNEFEQGIDRILEPNNAKVVLDDDFNPRSIIGESTDDAEVLDLLVDMAAFSNTSDIHIEPGKLTYNVFFRYLGKRKHVHSGLIDQYNRVCAMVKDRSRVDPMETRVPQDGSFSTKVRGSPYDVRVATLPVDGKEKITMRLLDPVRAQMRLAALGISLVEDWKRINEYRNGLVLIVGATGSGKTTTLNATIREMSRFEKAIYTAEDPVEYRIPYVTHVQMNEHVGLDFARSIKAFMRADPDVIVLGEIRDTVTAAKAIQAAETGHLVIATIHAESVPMALQRLRGLDVKTEDFEMLLRGILVQYLLRTLCPTCKGEGCDACFGEGYAGRTVVSEIARVGSPADVRKMMSPNPKDKYWRPLWKDLESKITTGVTDGREVYRAFSSELEEMAMHSPILKRVLTEERAKRDLVSAAASVAAIEALPPEEKIKARAIAQARLVAASAAPELIEIDQMLMDGEPLGKLKAIKDDG